MGTEIFAGEQDWLKRVTVRLVREEERRCISDLLVKKLDYHGDLC
jgi:hypothetical protein